jgi:hypothetical protein
MSPSEHPCCTSLSTPVAQLVEAAISKIVCVWVQIPPGVPNAAVAQLEEALVLETRGCGFDSH